MTSSGIVADGPMRLYLAIADEVWRKHGKELQEVDGFWAKGKVKQKIEKEISERWEKEFSAQMLW